MQFRNFKMVDYVVYGAGCFNQLGDILAQHRKGDAPMIFFVDDFFRDKPDFLVRVPMQGRDETLLIDVTHEPKTSYVDAIRDQLKEKFGTVSGIIGIGGGSVMDMAKAVALMMTNEGSSADYQGWDLIKNPAIYKVGIPTISGTGAEVSRTCVLTGPTKKLGINSDFTPFDQIVLDPTLAQTVPANQRFYTAMDCYIHCIESLNGTYINAFSMAYGEKAREMCEAIFLHTAEWSPASDEQLMMASYAGGMSIAYSQVGIAHAVSYGLGYLLGTKHGIGNCIVFDKLEDYYPEGVGKFKQMVALHEIVIPQNITQGLSDDDFDKMIGVSLGMAPLWENALGKDWKNIMTPEKLRRLYKQL